MIPFISAIFYVIFAHFPEVTTDNTQLPIAICYTQCNGDENSLGGCILRYHCSLPNYDHLTCTHYNVTKITCSKLYIFTLGCMYMYVCQDTDNVVSHFQVTFFYCFDLQKSLFEGFIT